MKILILLISIWTGLLAAVYAEDKGTRLSVAKAVKIVGKPGEPFANMDPAALQVTHRLIGLLCRDHYEYRAEDAATWKACMLNRKRNMYARLCAASFLLDSHEEARRFVKSQLVSKNIRHRYNAAQILASYVDETPAKAWAANLLVGLLVDGTIDYDPRLMDSDSKDYPNGDRNDTSTPLDLICEVFADMKMKSAVPGLIKVWERQPNTESGHQAARALGEIGDGSAVPILMESLKDKSGRQSSVIWALGELKAREAVPILCSRLSMDGTEDILAALLKIDDKRAIAPIEEYLREDFPARTKAVARRVLAQLGSPDPVNALLELILAETYEPERSELIKALAKFKDPRVVNALLDIFSVATYEPERSDLLKALAKFDDPRVVKKLAEIARTSDSALMRREAIDGLGQLGNHSSLLTLASLLDFEFSIDLNTDLGWKAIPDFRVYFPELIVDCLKYCTKQDFGKDRAKWEEWITKNVQQPGAGQPATEPADDAPVKDQPSTPTSTDAPR